MSIARYALLTSTLLVGVACGDASEAIEEHNQDADAHPNATLPDDLVTEDELASALDGIAPTTDASDLVTGTLDPARLPSEAVTEDELEADLVALEDRVSQTGGATGSRVAGTQTGTSGSNTVLVDSTAEVEISALTLDPGDNTAVAAVAHVYLERRAATSGRYTISLKMDACSSTEVIGSTLWRPPVSSATFVADAVTLTGFAEGLVGESTVVLCVRKFDSGAPDATAYNRGIVAHW